VLNDVTGNLVLCYGSAWRKDLFGRGRFFRAKPNFRDSH
jgi:hypothetical protein